MRIETRQSQRRLFTACQPGAVRGTDPRGVRATCDPGRVLFSRSGLLCSAMLVVAAASCGCTQVSGTSPRFQPVTIPDAQSIPRAVIYGSVTALLPHYDATPALEMFLYGPNEYGKTLVRNPQGMTLWNDRLLVCDQGLPDVVSISLKNGRSLPFTDIDHRPHCPVAVCADEAHVYVADPRSRCVVAYSENGKLMEELAPTRETQRRFQPASLALREGILYVGNVGEHRIDRLNLTTREWMPPMTPSGDLRLISPTGLAFTNDGTLLIADALQGRIFRCSKDGEWQSPIGRPGRGKGEFVRPKQICVMPSGIIVVADAGRQSLLMFSSEGNLLMEVSGGNPSRAGFTLPIGLLPIPADQLPAVSQPADEYLLVSDELGGTSLTLIGIVTGKSQEGAHDR